jgi:hypothetical protein
VLATLEEGKPPYVVFDLNSQPIVGENNYAHANAYAKALAVFLTGKTYVGKWRQDKGWRTTATMRIVITGVNTTTGEPAVVVEYPDKAATHGLVQIFYSPGIFAWLLNGKTGPINDGEMIVKAQASDREVATRIAQILLKENAFTDPTATYQLYENGFFKTTVKVKDKEVSIAEAFHTEGYPTMVKMRDGAYDGWFWFDGQFYEGKSAWSGLLTGDKEPLPASPNDGWDNKLFDAAPTDKSRCYAVNAQKGWQCPPTYPTGGGVGAVIPMTTGFAPYLGGAGDHLRRSCEYRSCKPGLDRRRKKEGKRVACRASPPPVGRDRLGTAGGTRGSGARHARGRSVG